jgi:hypothetical protein
MRYIVKISAGLHDTPNPTAPSTAGSVNVDDQVDADDDIAGKDFVKGEVVELPPRRTGWIATAALQPLSPPSTEIDAMGFYTFLNISTVGTGADQRYLFALAFAKSALKNEAGAIAGSDAFGPFQYNSARWAELLGSVGAGKGLQPEDRKDPSRRPRLRSSKRWQHRKWLTRACPVRCNATNSTSSIFSPALPPRHSSMQ